MIRAVLPAMRERGQGKIVNVTSLSGRIVAPMLSHYAATKFALEALGEGLRFEVGALGVEVCTVEPGMYASDWQTSNLAVTDGVAGGPYEELVAERLDGFRRLAATRPGSASVAAALADIVDLAQPLPLRWPVGYEATRDIAIRASRSDEEWEWLRRSGALGPWRRPLHPDPPAPVEHDWSTRQRRADHRRLPRLRCRGGPRAGSARQHGRGHDALPRARWAGRRRRLRGRHPPGAPRRHDPGRGDRRRRRRHRAPRAHRCAGEQRRVRPVGADRGARRGGAAAAVRHQLPRAVADGQRRRPAPPGPAVGQDRQRLVAVGSGAEPDAGAVRSVQARHRGAHRGLA